MGGRLRQENRREGEGKYTRSERKRHETTKAVMRQEGNTGGHEGMGSLA